MMDEEIVQCKYLMSLKKEPWENTTDIVTNMNTQNNHFSEFCNCPLLKKLNTSTSLLFTSKVRSSL